MISKILKLQSVGLLHNATQTNAVTLHQVTAIYADNGRGKSTLAAVLRACQLGDAGRLKARKTIDSANEPEVKFLLPNGSHVDFAANKWNTALSNIVIFDSEFVELNVYSGFEVRAEQRQSLLEFALGDQTVQLKQRIDQLSQSIEAETRKRTQIEKTLAGYALPFKVAEFIATQPVADVQQQIDERRKKIEAAKNAQALVARKDPTEVSAIQFDIEPVFALLQTRVRDVEETAESVVKVHFAKHAVNKFEDWVSQGQQYAGGADCPFCARPVDGLELITAYRSYFNKAYTDLKQRIAGLQSLVAVGLGDSKVEAVLATVATNAARMEAWKDQINIEIPALDGETMAASLKQIREELLSFAAKKQIVPLESVGNRADVDKATALIAEINQAIAIYNTSVRSVTGQIAEFKKKLGAENVAALTAEIQKLESAQKRTKPEVTNVIAEYQTAETERKRLDGEKTKARQQLDSLMQATLKQYHVSINKLLGIFGAEFTIEELKPTYVGGEPRTEYVLKVRNKAVKLGSRADMTIGHSFASTLSEADKRTLAFAFFLARLDGEPNLKDKLVVLDDPVSSLDRNRRHQSMRQVAELAEKCSQLLVLSHDAYFIRELRERLADKKPAPISVDIMALKRVAQGYSEFASCDIDDICSSDYYRNHRLVADFVDGKPTVNARDVAKAIRPMLEGYYHRRFPGRIPRKLMFGQIIQLATQASSGDPLFHLKPILKEMSEINDYAGQFHHDTNAHYDSAAINDSELHKFAQRALNLIYVNG